MNLRPVCILLPILLLAASPFARAEVTGGWGCGGDLDRDPATGTPIDCRGYYEEWDGAHRVTYSCDGTFYFDDHSCYGAMGDPWCSASVVAIQCAGQQVGTGPAGETVDALLDPASGAPVNATWDAACGLHGCGVDVEAAGSQVHYHVTPPGTSGA